MNRQTDISKIADEAREVEVGELPEPCAPGEPPAGGEGSEAQASTPLTAAEIDRMTTGIIDALKTVYDPEIPVDIYDLGLIYRVDIGEDRVVTIDMTLTAPGCPVAGDMPGWVENAVSVVEGVQEVKVNMVFDPPWTIDRMSEDAKFALNLF